MLNISHGRKLLSEDKEMTIEKLFIFKSNWKYAGKVQSLSCQVATFEYPLVKDFDELLSKEGVEKECYLNYEEDKKLFNQFQQFRVCLDNIYYYEKQIINLKNDKFVLEQSAKSLESNSNAAWLNQERIIEIIKE